MEGMYWGDFRVLIEANKKPWRAFRYYRDKAGFADTISICDFTLPRRKGVLSHKGWSQDDWYRDSFVCNAGYYNGFIPLRSIAGKWDDAQKRWVKKPARGVRDILQQLLAHDCIVKSEEVARIVESR